MAYFPEENVMRSRILNPVNLLVASTMLALTIPAGQTFIPINSGVLTISEVAGTGIGAFTVSAGTNATLYNNIYASLTPGLGSITPNTILNLSAQTKGIAAGASAIDIYLNISGIGVGFTTLKAIFYMPYILVKNP